MTDEPGKKGPLQDIGKKIGVFARQVGDAVSRAATVTDLTIRIKGRESERNRLLQQLGERLFSLTKQGQAPDLLKVVGEDLLRELERVEVDITTLREELRAVQEKARAEAASGSSPGSAEPSPPPPEKPPRES
jgi:hypothetical protein